MLIRLEGLKKSRITCPGTCKPVEIYNSGTSGTQANTIPLNFKIKSAFVVDENLIS
jgi:hypothetical protein